MVINIGQYTMIAYDEITLDSDKKEYHLVQIQEWESETKLVKENTVYYHGDIKTIRRMNNNSDGIINLMHIIQKLLKKKRYSKFSIKTADAYVLVE